MSQHTLSSVVHPWCNRRFVRNFTLSHEIRRDWKQKLKAAVPLGLGQTKPQHFRDMAGIAWENRDNLGYALESAVAKACATAARSASPGFTTGRSTACTSA